MREILNIVRFSFEGEKIEKKISGLIDRKDVEKIYHIIEAKLTEEEGWITKRL